MLAYSVNGDEYYSVKFGFVDGIDQIPNRSFVDAKIQIEPGTFLDLQSNSANIFFLQLQNYYNIVNDSNTHRCETHVFDVSKGELVKTSGPQLFYDSYGERKIFPTNNQSQLICGFGYSQYH